MTPPVAVRVLAPGDEPAVERFCAAHPDTTLFFQNNVATAGLVYRGERFQGVWCAAFEDGAIVALAGHFWNDNVILNAPRALAETVRGVLAASGRPVAALIGPWAQVTDAREILGLANAATTLCSPDDLLALALAALRVPEPLARGAWRARNATDDELAQLVAWRHDYSAELLGRPRGAALLAQSRREMEEWQSEGRNFVLVVDGALVACAGYNAMTPGCVQIGGVWTPIALRGRGYARAAVAGALLAARERGVARSILFTGAENRAAQAVYRALGYERVGDYGLVLFAEPHRKVDTGV